LQFYNNTALSNLNGLSALTTVGSYFNIQSNTALATIDGLANLTSVGTTTNDYFQVYSNGALTTMVNLIKPTGKFATLAGNLNIQYNAQLSQCQADALKNALAGGGWARTYNFTSNLACASPKTCAGTSGAVCQ
jgi:hypothetical protein